MNKLIEKLNQTPNVAGVVRYAWLGQCGYVFRYMGKTVLIDPMLNDCLDSEGNSCRYYQSPIDAADIACDFYLATHGHIDHLAPETAKKIYIRNPKCKFIVPIGITNILRSIGVNEENIIGIAPNDKTVELDLGISVCAVSAAHPKHIYDESNPDIAVSYVINFGGKKVIHLGDTYKTEPLLTSLQKHKGADLFLPPINGRECEVTMGFIGNMDAREAAEVAAKINAKLTIPTHFDMFKGNTADPSKLVEALSELAPNAVARIPVILETYDLYELPE